MFNLFKKPTEEKLDLRILDYIRAEDKELTDGNYKEYGKEAEMILDTKIFKHFMKKTLGVTATSLLDASNMDEKSIRDIKQSYEVILKIEKFFKDFKTKAEQLYEEEKQE